MKQQTNQSINGHLRRGVFLLLIPLLAVCVIPFARGQRDTTGRNFAKRVSPSVSSAPGWLSPALSPWSIVANYPAVIQSPAVSTDGTYAYSGGGSDNFVPIDGFYRYDPVADMWTTLASLPQALFDARAAYAANVNKIYVFGGLDAGVNVLSTTYIYDIATDSWTTGAAMPAARFFPAVTYDGANGKIYVIGGLDASFLEASQTWEYDPVADTWDTSRTSIPVAMGGSATSIVDQNIYLAGSFGATGGTTLHYRYDILADSWTQMADVPAPVYEAAGAAVGSQTYVVGGGNPSVGAWATRQARVAAVVKAPAVSYNTTYIYDIPSNTWASGPNTNVAHSFTGGTAIGNLLIVVAGFDGVTGNTNTVETALAEGSPTPTPSPSVSPSVTPTATPTATPTTTPTPSVTPSPTPTPSATPTVTPTPSATPGGCVFGFGYWKNHPQAWPVTELQLGNVTYTQDQLLSIMHEPVRGNGLVSLAHHLITAKLNVANGADPSCIQQTIADADALIGDLVVPPVGDGYLAPRDVNALKDTLEDYNEGHLCAPSCDNEGSPTPSPSPPRAPRRPPVMPQHQRPPR